MADLGRELFSFAVISDTHVNPDDDTCNSPFPVNARANRRFRHVVADLNQRDIEFVVHLGDLVHPVPESGALYAQAAEAYRQIVADLKVPIHILPGNHDIGDTPIKGAPAGPVTPSMIAAWTQEFGAQYNAFSHGGLRFVCLNAQLINSGLPDEAAQEEWAAAQMNIGDERQFLMLHHPPYLCSPDEPNHYDNTDAPGRDWVLNLVQDHKVEAMFAGHAHNFWYNRIGATDYYLAPSTSFVRQDYSEMSRTKPPEGSELGRDDRAKLGYFIVTVFEHGHDVQIVRSFGAELGPDDAANPAAPVAKTPGQNNTSLIGFDLRHNWAEITEVPPLGGLDEFDRKQVRNDYSLLGLIEMGIRDIRVPLTDLRDPVRFERLGALWHLGFRPTLFSFGVPSNNDLALIKYASDRLQDWEMTVDWATFDQDLSGILAAHNSSDLPLYISRMRTKADLPTGGTYFHVINHGFSAGDAEQLGKLHVLKSQGIAGAVFRLGAQDSVTETLHEIDDVAGSFSIKASVHLRLAGDNPAVEQDDMAFAKQRVSEAMSTAQGMINTRIFCDSLMENDRGYFARVGALDRTGNPNLLLETVKRFHMG